MKQFLYLAWWFFQVRFLGKRKPLQSVIFVNNECNLRCKHCCIEKDKKTINKTFEQIKEELEYSYKLGSRFVDFEGGEPALWHEDGKNINDIIRLAKQTGFYTCTVTTNAQKPFDWIEADFIWVSLDGVANYHDVIRGEGAFAKLLENVELYGKIKKKPLSANMTINTINEQNVGETIKFVSTNRYLTSISLNFYMPFNDEKSLCVENRNKIIDKIITMKKQGYPVTNTLCGLKGLKKAQTGKYCWITNFITPEGERLEACSGKSLDMCKICGYGMASEMACLYNFNLETILSGIKLRLFKKM